MSLNEKFDNRALRQGENVEQFLRAEDWNAVIKHVRGYINVQEPPYNAVGDGVTDDTAAIQAAITAATAGQTVLVPASATTYKTSDVLTVSNSGVRILGYGATIEQTGALKSGVVVSAATGVTIEGLRLLNSTTSGGWDGTDKGVNGIYFFNGSNDGSAINCRIEGYGNAGIRIYRSARVHLVGNRIVGIGTAGGLVAGSNYSFGIHGYTDGALSTATQIIGGEIREVGTGIQFGNDWIDTLVQGVNVYDIRGQHGMYIDGAKGLRIIGNSVRNAANIGIKVQQEATGASDVTGLVVSGNTVDTTGQVGIALLFAASATKRFKSPVVSGNTVLNTTTDGILVEISDDPLIVDNVVRTAGAYGIRLSSSNPTAGNAAGRVAGNLINSTQLAGMNLTADLTGALPTVVEDNILTDTGLTGGVGVFAIGFSTGSWIARRNIIRNSAAPTYQYNIFSSAGSTLQWWPDNVTDTTKSHSLLGTLNALGPGSVSADRGDTAQTLTVDGDAEEQLWGTPLTANRTVTLSTTNAIKGKKFYIRRTGGDTGGPWNLAVGSGPLKNLAANTWCVVKHNGTAWVLVQYGAL